MLLPEKMHNTAENAKEYGYLNLNHYNHSVSIIVQWYSKLCFKRVHPRVQIEEIKGLVQHRYWNFSNAKYNINFLEKSLDIISFKEPFQ